MFETGGGERGRFLLYAVRDKKKRKSKKSREHLFG